MFFRRNFCGELPGDFFYGILEEMYAYISGGFPKKKTAHGVPRGISWGISGFPEKLLYDFL